MAFGNIRRLLIFHNLRMYLRILSSCLTTFGLGTWFFYYLLKIPAKLLYVRFTLFLDNIFFPKYRNVKVEKPIFIVGQGRSATTFMHEILTQTEEFVVFKNWEIRHPSLTARRLLQHSRALRTLVDVFITELHLTPHRVKQAIQKRLQRKGSFKSHQQFLEGIAQEEEHLFNHVLDTQFITFCTPLGFCKKGYPELVFHDEQPHQEKSVRFLKSCFKRQIYHTGRKQIIAKINTIPFRIKSMLKVFPDLRIIYLIRSPVEQTISHLSLHRRIIDENFGLDNIPAARLQQYRKHRYENNILYYKHVDKLLRNNEVPRGQMIQITYDSIRNELGKVLDRIKDFTGLEFSPELEERLREQVKRQSSYKRKHENLPLEAFSLTEEKVRADFDFVFQRYRF